MKEWIKKIAQQFEVEKANNISETVVSDEIGTLVYILDVYHKHLIDTPNFSSRKVREQIDHLSKELLNPHNMDKEEILFKTRQFFNSYRVDEITYVQHTFEDFKKIIWDFADQLKDEIKDQKKMDSQLDSHLKELRDAVESNSIEGLRKKSKDFIHSYVEVQNKKEINKEKRISNIKRNLNQFKKKLSEAEVTLNHDHLTGAHNRRYFEEQVKSFLKFAEVSEVFGCLFIIDIDFFKKINDQFGHDIGDFVLKECVKVLKSIFMRDLDVVARMGGEEFAILLPEYKIEHALKKANEVLDTIRRQIFVHGSHQIRFTASIGISEFKVNDQLETWYKRADQALYEAKNTGRDRFVCAEKNKAAA